jgi:hypothetical protein
LIDILQHRLTEHRRDLLAGNIKNARKEYSMGKVKKGTVDDLVNDLTI